MAESVACKSNKTKKAPQSSGALFLLNREEAYFFFFVVVLVFALVVVDAAGVVLAVVSIFMPVSIAAGAGAIAGAEVSEVDPPSFFDHGASTSTVGRDGGRHTYVLLERQTCGKSPVLLLCRMADVR